MFNGNKLNSKFYFYHASAFAIEDNYFFSFFLKSKFQQQPPLSPEDEQFKDTLWEESFKGHTDSKPYGKIYIIHINFKLSPLLIF